MFQKQPLDLAESHAHMAMEHLAVPLVAVRNRGLQKRDL